MEQSGIEVGVRAIRKWWESACRENRPFVILCENANEHREEAKRNRGGRVHAIIAKHESQSTLILIYVSQTSTEMERNRSGRLCYEKEKRSQMLLAAN